MAYLSQEIAIPPPLSNLDPFIQNKGIQGASLAIEDNNTTGQFTGQTFVLDKFVVKLGDSVSDAFKQIVATGYSMVIVNLSVDAIKSLMTLPEFSQVLILDATSRDDQFRNKSCHVNMLHLLPSRAMRADAIGQFLLKKRWRDWFLVVGPSQQDKRFADAVRRTAKRLGMKIVKEKPWDHTFDARRTAQSDVPVFTQGVDYDVLVVADEVGLFGEYLPYRTWLPRPIVGTQGLVATAWHRTHEQWGAVQLQNRFKEQAGRWMVEEDYGVYLAIRAIGEAATRTQSNAIAKIKPFLMSDQFSLQGYKGVPLSFRSWNGQLRQPVLLAADRSLVGSAPIEGFLHPKNELDSLGYDQSDSSCQTD